jgi:hypothetical protein
MLVLLLAVVVMAVGSGISPRVLSESGEGQPPKLPLLTVCPEGPPRCDFVKVQEAIAAAEPGDFIQVLAGIYQENLVIAKSLHLVGAGHDQVRIQGVEPGRPTITLQVEGEMKLFLDGLTIVGGPPASAEKFCLEEGDWRWTCPNGLR